MKKFVWGGSWLVLASLVACNSTDPGSGGTPTPVPTQVPTTTEGVCEGTTLVSGTLSFVPEPSSIDGKTIVLKLNETWNYTLAAGGGGGSAALLDTINVTGSSSLRPTFKFCGDVPASQAPSGAAYSEVSKVFHVSASIDMDGDGNTSTACVDYLTSDAGFYSVFLDGEPSTDVIVEVRPSGCTWTDLY